MAEPLTMRDADTMAAAEHAYPSTYRYDGDDIPNRDSGPQRVAFMAGALWAFTYPYKMSQVEAMREALDAMGVELTYDHLQTALEAAYNAR